MSKMQFIKRHKSNQILNMVRYRMSKHTTSLSYRPIELVLFITYRCMLNCDFCIIKSPNTPYKNIESFEDISFKKFKRVIDNFREATYLTLSGGEPFLHRNIFDMIDYGAKRKMEVIIYSNGTLIGGKMDKILESPLSLLNISLNACDDKEYEVVTRSSKQTFETLIDDMTELIRRRNEYNKDMKVQISYICTKDNYKRIPDMVRLGEELCVDNILLENLIATDVPGFSADQCLYDDDPDVIEIIDAIDLGRVKPKIFPPQLYSKEIEERRCEMPFITLSINGNGSISPCCKVLPNKKYGNVFEEDVWNNETYQRIRAIMIDKSLPLPKLCKTCHEMAARFEDMRNKML